MNTRTLFEREFEAGAPKQVDSITIKWEQDGDADHSHLGEYSNTPAEHHIDRRERGDQGRNEFRYFNLGCGDAEYLENDYERAEALNKGNWCFMGCRAVAQVSYPIGQGNRRIETLSSGGLWGIESDSGREYVAEVEAQELKNLKEHLAQFGIEWPELETVTT